MKSPRKALADASELMAVSGVTNRELVACSVYGGLQTSIQLRPHALVRVCELLRVPHSKVRVRVDERGNLHAQFTARGAEWCCFVSADSEEGRRWRELVNGRRALSAPSPRALPAGQHLLLGVDECTT